MVSDYTVDYRDMDFARRTVVLDISASPRLWNEGDSMDFIIESDEGKVTADGVYSDGAVTASVEVPLADNIEVSALIMNGGTTKQEKLDELYELLSMHLLDVSGHVLVAQKARVHQNLAGGKPADLTHHQFPGAGVGVGYHGFTVFPRQRQRLFAENMLSGGQRVGHHLSVKLVGRGDDHRVNGRVSEHLQVVGENMGDR